ncbi:hypothetical protein FB45DRAFT_924776 [Roridomyces roridus]|uniref:Uncharacterized protein n=1 Tax=Roridomyces roridus TaxID=1738132 RepID=A0AAD7BJG4_9AGAR|nr:hypothetical protein FB45DRAFT_924776 [Roridomyces roridus]
MILDTLQEREKELLDVPTDAPPSYEASSGSSSSRAPPATHDTKRPITVSAASSSVIKPPPVSSPSSWFGFTSPTTRQVRTTVLGLVRDLVKLPPSDHGVVAISILKSCAEACATNGLNISTILQEQSVEGHTPLYWAIVKRPAESAEGHENSTDLLTTLLSLSTPLTPAYDLPIDQVLFQRLRSSPEFAPMSPTDEMLLDATIPPDEINVENMGGEAAQEGAFVVDFSIVRFQKRMLVSKAVILEFIARGRMWQLGFHVSTPGNHRRLPPGTWYAELALLENSPPTWLDSRLLIPAPAETAMGPPSAGIFGTGKSRPRPTLSVRIKANEQLRVTGPGARHRSRVVVLLDGPEADNGFGCLQYSECPYIGADETLRGRLEARLAKPEAECIIC